LKARLTEKVELILHNPRTARINQSFFSKVCDEISDVAKASSIEQISFLEKIFELLADAFEERVSKFVNNVVCINEFLRKQRKKINCSNTHNWPCNCPEDMCKSGQRDFQEYLVLLNIIDNLLIDIIKIFDSPKLLMVNKNVRMFEYEEWLNLINSMQEFTDNRLMVYGDALGESQF